MSFDLKQALQDETLLLLHQQNDGERLTVYQNNAFRWLQLGTIVQSVMSLQEPQRPILSYLQPLLLIPYLRPDIQHILELGLGGGAIQRFFANKPQQVTSVEWDPGIIEVYQQYFAIDNAGTVIQDDAAHYVQQGELVDWLIVDLFNHDGASPFTFHQLFYQFCAARLTEQGILSVNLLPETPLQIEIVKELLEGLFAQPAMEIRLPGYKNRLLTISKTPLPELRYCDALVDYANQHQLDLNQFQIVS
ncbi:spermidine synthase [Bowmanella sp. JS7-9]|uniref:Spermidine synthase n=1 Tax=Pseudobowmanella zhangzhouensis TaxID=1537679 RepID=A0ABW1XN73_9ALTE|nr:hypothetical protein [Bowmanella sp. JS7-9]TBX21771.1 hypothetical protein TK45_09640 [Bowmanella sp. JS7-9]